MPLSKTHSLPSKKDRKPKPYGSTKGNVIKAKEFNEAEGIIDKLYADICNGVSKFDCLQKLESGFYGKTVSKRMAFNYYNAAFDRLAINADVEAERLRQLLFSRYESLLEDAVTKGDIYNARGILDSMAKIFLGVDKPQTAIQINSDKENGITVNFGFSKNDEET